MTGIFSKGTGRSIPVQTFLLIGIIALALVGPAGAALITMDNSSSTAIQDNVPLAGGRLVLSPDSSALVTDNPALPGSRGVDTNSEPSPDRFRKEGTWSLNNSGQKIGIAATGTGTIILTDTNGSVVMQLAGIGRLDEFQTAEPGKIRASPDRLDIARPGYTEWYVMKDAGIEQGLTVDSRPSGNGTLLVNYTLAGDLRPVLAGQTLIFFDATGPVMNYGGLAASDATGRELPATLALSSGTLTWQIDDRNAVYPIVIDPYIVSQTAILNASDAAASAYFGQSVAISGNTAVIGAYNASVNAKNSAGQAYVFTNSGGSWTQTAILNASDAAAGAYFGQSAAISGNTAVIGANGATVGSNTSAGQVYIFTNSGGTWTQAAILNASDAENSGNFGYSVRISGDGNTAVIGAYGVTVGTNTSAGQAYIFTNGGGTWTQAAILNASDAEQYGHFGYSVGISEDGNTAVIGAAGATVSLKQYAGKAYVFRNTGGLWSEKPILNASDPDEDAAFGNSVGISGDGNTAIIGAAGATVGGQYSAGQVYIFTNSGGAWTQISILNASDAYGDRFGNSVAISGDGNTAVIGASWTTVGGKYSAGQEYVFTNSGGAWTQISIFNASDAAAGAYFGGSTAISGNTVVIGSSGATAGGKSRAGKAYVFSLSSPVTSSGSGTDTSGDTGRATSFAATAPGTGAGGTMTFAINEPLSAGSTAYPYAISAVSIVPSETLGSTELIVTGDGATANVPDGRMVAGIVAISPVAVNPSSISSGTITFEVSGAWLSAHGLTPADIVMMRYHDGAWAELPTTYQNAAGGADYFTATTPGFSYFAIAARTGTASANATVTEPAAASVPLGTIQVAAMTTTVPASANAAPAGKSAPVTTATTAVPAGATGSPGFPVLAILAGIGGIAVVAVGAVLARRWWIRRQNPALFRDYD
jgi:PGF-pre-PGF domain-containing protein